MSAGAGSQTLAYPSPQFPGPPEVAVDIPGVPFVGVNVSWADGPDADAEYAGIQQVMQTVRVQR